MSPSCCHFSECPLSGKKKAYTAPLQWLTFLCRKKKMGGHRAEISVVDMVVLFFNWISVSTTGLESLSFWPEKFSKLFSFSSGSVRFFLLCLCTNPEAAIRKKIEEWFFRRAPATFNFLRLVMRAILFVRPKCSHSCVSLKEPPLKPVQILEDTPKNSTEQTAMRTKWF